MPVQNSEEVMILYLNFVYHSDEIILSDENIEDR